MKSGFLYLLLIINSVGAFTISGTVYDSNFNRLNNAAVQLYPPKQFKIASSGTYNFEVPPGEYELTVTNNEKNLTFKENLTIINSNVNFDVVLINTALEDDELNELSQAISENYSITNQDFTSQKKTTTPNANTAIIAAALLLLAAIALIAMQKRKRQNVAQSEKIKENKELQEEKQEKPKEVDEFKKKILALIDSKGGAASQKELRNELPWSEARVSIELTELENQGKIKRIKTGRANLIKKV